MTMVDAVHRVGKPMVTKMTFFAIFHFKIVKERKAKLAPLECKVRRAKKVTWEIVEQVLVSCTLLETLHYTRTNKRIHL